MDFSVGVAAMVALCIVQTSAMSITSSTTTPTPTSTTETSTASTPYSTTPIIYIDCLYPMFMDCSPPCSLNYDTGGPCPDCQCIAETNPASTTETPTTTTTPYPCPICPTGCTPEYDGRPDGCVSGCQCATATTTPCLQSPCPIECTPIFGDSCAIGCQCSTVSTPYPTVIDCLYLAFVECPPWCNLDYDTGRPCPDCLCPETTSTSTTETTTSTPETPTKTTPTSTVTTECLYYDCQYFSSSDYCYEVYEDGPDKCATGCRCDTETTPTSTTETPTTETTTGTSQNTVVSPICQIPKCPRGWYLVYGDNTGDCPTCKRHTCEDITCDEDEKCKMVGKKPRCFKKRMFNFRDLLLLLRIRLDDDDD